MNEVALDEVRDPAFVDLQGQKNGAVVDLHLLTFDGDPLASLEVGAPQRGGGTEIDANGAATSIDHFSDHVLGGGPAEAPKAGHVS
jgi:hypothetical protein